MKIPVILPLLFLFLFVAVSADAQTCGPPDPAAGLFSGVPFFARPLEQDRPGIANPANPLVSTPYFRAEAGFRALSATLTSATYTAPDLAAPLDLKEALGLPPRGVFVEFSGRLQLSRFSGRAHYDLSVGAVTTERGYVNWPDLRVGADADLIDWKGLRFGLTADINPRAPSVYIPDAAGVVTPVLGAIPWTVGLHCSYNPPGCFGISSSFDTRVRWPAGTGSRITEFEIAAGLRSPTTLLGTCAVRAGWRFTQLGIGSDGRDAEFKSSAIFGEYVYSF